MSNGTKKASHKQALQMGGFTMCYAVSCYEELSLVFAILLRKDITGC